MPTPGFAAGFFMDVLTETIPHAAIEIVMHVARHLPGFRVLGSQFSPIILGCDDHGAVGVVIAADDTPLTRAAWEAAATDAAMLGMGPGVTLLGTHNAAPLESTWRFVQVVRRGDRWVAVDALDAPLFHNERG